jgi:hypothetical protein
MKIVFFQQILVEPLLATEKSTLFENKKTFLPINLKYL